MTLPVSNPAPPFNMELPPPESPLAPLPPFGLSVDPSAKPAAGVTPGISASNTAPPDPAREAWLQAGAACSDVDEARMAFYTSPSPEARDTVEEAQRVAQIAAQRSLIFEAASIPRWKGELAELDRKMDQDTGPVDPAKRADLAKRNDLRDLPATLIQNSLELWEKAKPTRPELQDPVAAEYRLKGAVRRLFSLADPGDKQRHLTDARSAASDNQKAWEKAVKASEKPGSDVKLVIESHAGLSRAKEFVSDLARQYVSDDGQIHVRKDGP